MRLLLAAALSLVLAGCSTPPIEGASVEPAVSPDLAAYSLTCLEGGQPDPVTEVCRTEYAEPNRIFFMQRLRAAPNQPGLVVGAGIEASRSLFPGLPRAEPLNPGLDLQRPVIHVSEDGGATWTKRNVPDIRPEGLQVPVNYVAQSLTADVAIDDRGALHLAVAVQPQVLTWMAGDPPTEAYSRLFLYHISSPDLGLTWSDPVFLGVEDPQWYPRIEWWSPGLTVLWSDGSLNASTSSDGGLTWHPADVVPRDGAEVDETPATPACTWTGFPAQWNGSLYVPCWSGPEQGEPGRLKLARLDGDGTLRTLSDDALDGPACDGFMLGAGPDGLAVVGSGCPGLHAATSRDGIQWKVVDLAATLNTDDDYAPWHVNSFAVAPDGSLHVQLTHYSVQSMPTDPVPFGTFATAGLATSVASLYASLGPGFSKVLHEELLQEGGDGCRRHATSLVGVGAAIEFWEGGGIVGYGCYTAMLVVGLKAPA